jgi:hypothetical protein
MSRRIFPENGASLTAIGKKHKFIRRKAAIVLFAKDPIKGTIYLLMQVSKYEDYAFFGGSHKETSIEYDSIRSRASEGVDWRAMQDKVCKDNAIREALEEIGMRWLLLPVGTSGAFVDYSDMSSDDEVQSAIDADIALISAERDFLSRGCEHQWYDPTTGHTYVCRFYFANFTPGLLRVTGAATVSEAMNLLTSLINDKLFSTLQRNEVAGACFLPLKDVLMPGKKKLWAPHAAWVTSSCDRLSHPPSFAAFFANKPNHTSWRSRPQASTRADAILEEVNRKRRGDTTSPTDAYMALLRALLPPCYEEASLLDTPLENLVFEGALEPEPSLALAAKTAADCLVKNLPIREPATSPLAVLKAATRRVLGTARLLGITNPTIEMMLNT